MLACGSLIIHTHHAMGHKSGVHFRVPRSRLHPLRQVSATSRQGQQILKVELQFEFGDAIFLFEFVHYIHCTVSRSGELIPRTTALEHSM